MKISKWTIVRTIMTALVALNLLLKAIGVEIINVDENAVVGIIEALIEVGCIICIWWYNNSFSDEAKRADAFFKTLKESGKNV